MIAGPATRALSFRLGCVCALGLLAGLSGCRRSAPEALAPSQETAAAPAGYRAALAAAELAATRAPAGRLDLGRLHHANRQFAAARAAYLPLVDDPGLGARACHYLADLAGTEADPGAELHWLRETLHRAPAYVPAALRLAEATAKSGAVAAAAAAFATVLRLDPGNRAARLAQARERLRVGDPAGATVLLEDLIAQHPDSSVAHALLAQLVAARGDEPRAAALRRQAQARKDLPPSDPWLDEVFDHCFDADQLTMRFEDAAKAGRPEETLRWVRRLETVAPRHWLVAQFRGLALEHGGDLAGAAREYQRGLEAGGAPEKLAPPLVHAWQALGRPAEAEAAARAALRAAPHTPALLLPLAELRARAGDFAEAERLLAEVLAFYPRHAAASRQLAPLWWERGDRARARPLLQDAVAADPLDAASRGLLGRLELEAGDAAAAVPPLAEALRLEPASAEISEWLSLAHLRLGNEAARAARWAEAQAAYDRAIAARPTGGEAYANRARLHVRVRAFAAAEESLRPLFAVAPDNPEGLLVLGDIQLATGRAAQARATWTRAAQALADPESPSLREALARRLTALRSP